MYKRSAQGWLKHLDFILWDLLVLQVSFVLGYMIRHGWGIWPYQRRDYLSLSIILAVVDLLVIIVFDSMHNVMRRNKFREIPATLRHVALVLVLMSLYLFSTQVGDVYSRITIYLTAGFHLVFGYFTRCFWKRVIRHINRNKAKKTMILVAEESAVPRILDHATTVDDFVYTGIVLSNRDGTGETIENVPVIASLDTAADYICRKWVDEVFVYPEHLADLKMSAYEAAEFLIDDTYGTQPPPKPQPAAPEEQTGVARLIEKCREMAIPVHVRLPITSAGGKSFMEKVGGYNVLTMTSNYISPAQQIFKRFMDILGGIVGSLIALILMAVLGPKIKKQSPGPILFKQTRIGRNGKKFKLYKIRSMVMDAEEKKAELQEENRVTDGRMFKVEFDPRIIGNKVVDGKQITGIGEKIRRRSLDEFPQFFNVLKGDMSMVGTRPPTEDEWNRYLYHHRARLATKPGITGLWQVSGRSKITDFEEVVRLDTQYINNWSVMLDVKILAKTVKTVLKKDGAM